MDLVLLKKLMKMIDESTINDFELETEGIKIKLSKGQSPTQIVTVPQQITAMPPAPLGFSSSLESNGEEAVPNADNDNQGYYEIRSPIVGTFYRSPSPESQSFVEIGASIELGTTLCIIEAMKLMNEIESDVSGTIVKVLVESGQPVEYNQVLFLIKTD